MPATADASPAIRPAQRGVAWGSVAILMALSLLSTLDRQVIALLVDPIKHDLGLTDTEIGLLQGFAFALFYSLAAVPIGALVDRYPRRRIIYIGVTLWSLCAAGCGLATRFVQLFVARIGVGIGEATLSPATVSLIGDLFARDKAATPMGVYLSSISLGSGVSLLLSGLIVGLFAGRSGVDLPLLGTVTAWQAVFLCTGLPGLLLGLIALLLPEPRPPGYRGANAEGAGSMAAYLATNKAVVVWTFMGFSLAALLFYAMGAWTPAFLGRRFGLAAREIGGVWGPIVAGAGALGTIVGGLLIDGANRRGVRAASLAVPAAAALIAIPALAIGYMSHDLLRTLILLGLGTMLIGIVSAGSLVTIQRIAPPAFRGRLSALFGLVSMAVGATFGPLVVGLLSDYVLHDPLAVGTALAMVAAIVLPVMALAMMLGRAAIGRGSPGAIDEEAAAWPQGIPIE